MICDETLIQECLKLAGEHNHLVRERLTVYRLAVYLSDGSPTDQALAEKWDLKLREFVLTGEVGVLGVGE